MGSAKSTRWGKIKSTVIVGTSVLSLLGVAYGLFTATRSPMFLVRIVEVADLPEDAPVDAQTLTDLAAIPVAKVNLFDLELGPIEKRIMTHEWIREVHLQKRFPQTVSVSVVFREPQALIQRENGALSYVDSDGRVFGQVSLRNKLADLPMLSGFNKQPQQKVVEALALLQAWGKSQLETMSQISSLSYDEDRGYRALVTYSLVPYRKARAMIDLGQDLDANLDTQLGRLRQVLKYLASHSIAARQIWADADKKIVVKINRGS